MQRLAHGASPGWRQDRWRHYTTAVARTNGGRCWSTEQAKTASSAAQRQYFGSAVSLGGCREPHHLLADIAARQHVDERGWSRLETLGDRLAEFEAAGAEPFHQLVERLVAPRQVAADAEALQHDTLVEEDADVAQALAILWAFAAVVL